MSLPSRVTIVEVGPRDGLQNEAGSIPLETKLQLAEEENRELDSSGDRYWFLVGAAAAIGGMLVGLLVSRVSWTRRQNWDEL